MTPDVSVPVVAFIDGILASPGAAMLVTQDEWPKLRMLCRDHNLSANALPDAWFATSVLQQQEVLVTVDRDFVRPLPSKRLQLPKPAL